MSTIDTSDGGYRYFHKQMDELEEEFATKKKKLEKDHARRINNMEKSYRADMLEHERDMSETVQNVKDNVNDVLSQERARNKAEVQRIKRDTYDRFGRYGGQEADVVKHQLQQAVEDIDAIREKSKTDLELAEQHYSDRVRDMNEDFARDMESEVEIARSSANESLRQKELGTDAYYKDLKSEFEKKHEELEKKRMEEINFARRNALSAIEDSREMYEHQLGKQNRVNNERNEAREIEYLREAEKVADTMRKLHADQTGQLRAQVKDLTDNEKQYAAERAHATQAAIQDNESDWRRRQEKISEVYEAELDNLARKLDESEEYLTQRGAESVRDKEAYYTQVLRQANQDHFSERNRITKSYESAMDEMEKSQERDQKLLEQAADRRVQGANEARDRALAKQAESYQMTMKDMRKSKDSQIKTLEDSLREKTSSLDLNDLSPAAEAAVRKSVIQEYEKVYNADRDRSDRTVESIRDDYAHRLTSQVIESQKDKTEMARRSAMESTQLRNSLVNTIQETEFEKKEAIKDSNIGHDREMDNMLRKFAQTLERQKLRYEQIVQLAQDDAQSQISQLRSEFDFERKMTRKSFEAKQNELIRDYEKKLADQKMELEFEVEETKNESERKLREAERHQKAMMEDQQRSYEYRIKQLEFQQNERERYLSSQHANELDKVKRANALLIQKKS